MELLPEAKEAEKRELNEVKGLLRDKDVEEILNYLNSVAL
jgi:hypothetical protein